MSGLNKDQLCFDPTELAESDNVGAYLRSADGTLLTHTTLGGKERLDTDAAIRASNGDALTATGTALDVNIASGTLSGIALDGVYDGVSNTDPSNTGIIAHTRAASPGDTNQLFRSTGDNPDSDNIASANVHGLDVNSFMHVYDATGGNWDRLTKSADGLEVDTGAVKFDLDGSIVSVREDTGTPANNRPLPVKLTGITGDINITANDLNVQLSHIGANFDSTRIGDGTETVNITTNSDMQVSDRSNSGIASSSKTIGDTLATVVTTALAERKFILIQNRAKSILELGGPAFTDGIIVPGRSSITLKVGPGIALNAKREAGKSGDIRVLELA